MATKDPRVDAYIATANPFARPILKKLRKLVHDTVPDVREEIKWKFPHFEYKGMFAGMAAFKEHCTFGFWKHALLVDKIGTAKGEGAMGSFGCITSLNDLPSDAKLRQLILAAKKLNDDGVKTPKRKITPVKDRVVTVPADLKAALKGDRKAQQTFDAFPYSRKKDYVEWLTEAKTDATRAKRLATAIAWLAEGKSRMWKYEK